MVQTNVVERTYPKPLFYVDSEGIIKDKFQRSSEPTEKVVNEYKAYYLVNFDGYDIWIDDDFNYLNKTVCGDTITVLKVNRLSLTKYTVTQNEVETDKYLYSMSERMYPSLKNTAVAKIDRFLKEIDGYISSSKNPFFKEIFHLFDIEVICDCKFLDIIDIKKVLVSSTVKYSRNSKRKSKETKQKLSNWRKIRNEQYKKMIEDKIRISELQEIELSNIAEREAVKKNELVQYQKDQQEKNDRIKERHGFDDESFTTSTIKYRTINKK